MSRLMDRYPEYIFDDGTNAIRVLPRYVAAHTESGCEIFFYYDHWLLRWRWSREQAITRAWRWLRRKVHTVAFDREAAIAQINALRKAEPL